MMHQHMQLPLLLQPSHHTSHALIPFVPIHKLHAHMHTINLLHTTASRAHAPCTIACALPPFHTPCAGGPGSHCSLNTDVALRLFSGALTAEQLPAELGLTLLSLDEPLLPSGAVGDRLCGGLMMLGCLRMLGYVPGLWLK